MFESAEFVSLQKLVHYKNVEMQIMDDLAARRLKLKDFKIRENLGTRAIELNNFSN